MIISTQQTNRRTVAHVFSTPAERNEAAAIATALGRKITYAGTTGLVIVTPPWYQTHPTAARWVKIISLIIITDYLILLYWGGRYAYRQWNARTPKTSHNGPYAPHSAPVADTPRPDAPAPSRAARTVYAAITAAPSRVRTRGPIRVDTAGAVYYYRSN